jgi:hypothetical protein
VDAGTRSAATNSRWVSQTSANVTHLSLSWLRLSGTASSTSVTVVPNTLAMPCVSYETLAPTPLQAPAVRASDYILCAYWGQLAEMLSYPTWFRWSIAPFVF